MSTQDPSAPAPPEEGALISVEHEGSVVAVAMLDGELYAVDDTCPHAGCSLAEGELEGRTVVCPCHMATFDLTTGAVVEGPTESGVATWSATVRDGSVELTDARGSESPADAPEAPAAADPAPSAPVDMDITVLVEQEHDAMRDQFEAIDSLTDPDDLAQAWSTLSDLLEIHASGEEALLYPKMARSDEAGLEEAEHAIREHNDLRDHARAVGDHPVGSDDWWRAVREVREVNEEHLQEEEGEGLPLFRKSTDRARREELGHEWVSFHQQHKHAEGLSGADVNPQAVIGDSHAH